MIGAGRSVDVGAPGSTTGKGHADAAADFCWESPFDGTAAAWEAPVVGGGVTSKRNSRWGTLVCLGVAFEGVGALRRLT